MWARLFVVFTLASSCVAAHATRVDNAAGSYTFSSLPSTDVEHARTNTFYMSDQQPLGRYVHVGDVVNVEVKHLPARYEASIMLGFRSLWHEKNDQQEVPLHDGDNRFMAERDGPLFIRFVAPSDKPNATSELSLSISGSKPLPLYMDGQTTRDEWEAQLANYGDAPFVQFMGRHSMITLPVKVHREHPVANPSATFAVIEQVLAMEDELAGFDGATGRDARSSLRQHFLVDFLAPDDAPYYMYCTDQFIAMRPDNTEDLTDPATLRHAWGIWHELGHAHQQESWTWDSVTEVSTNIFSLYVQEKMGLPSRLDVPEEDGRSPRDRAKDYLAQPSRNYLAGEEDESAEWNDPFIKLVMFDELRQAYGWDLYKDVFKYYREHPLSDDATNQEKADQFAVVLCKLTSADLRPFLERWGFHLGPQAMRAIDNMHLTARDI
ncbi:M60 family metallopeptidase [Dyella silvae]|uniref:M60 family metallopeptidase n=1 Tax=Dyella silvae TaxID=2994424 RepID=UPI002264B6BA|nr:M60 family metallopeptidase [Dyella silvae]